MINVGINENVILTKAEVSTENNKVSLSLYFREGGDETKSAANPFAALQSGEEVETGNGSDKGIKMWPPLVPMADKTDGTMKTVGEKSKEAGDALAEVQNALIQIMSCYTTKDKFKFNMFKGMDNMINADNYETKIVEEEVIHKAFHNLATQFVEFATPFFDNEDFPVRLLLVRQKKKHWPEIRRRFVKDNPFIESASIPKAQSKLAFTKYEKDNGFDKPEYVTQADADAPAEDAENVFQES